MFSQQEHSGPVVALPVVPPLSVYKLLFLLLQQYFNLSRLPPLDIWRLFTAYGQNEKEIRSHSVG